MQRFLKNNPLLLLAFPLMAGIAFSWFFNTELITAVLLLSLFSVTLFTIFLLPKLPRWIFGVALVAAFFSLGVFAEAVDRRPLEQQWSGANGSFDAILLETPHIGGKATRIKARVMRLGRDSIVDARREGIVYLYFENSVELEELGVGDKVFFKGKVQNPRNNGNPAEFDTEHYMYVNGVTGTAYIDRKGWNVNGSSSSTFSMRAMMLREKIVNMYASLGLSMESEAILSALTVGEKRDLSNGVRDLYAAVGASHVLALSGLHLGILYMVLTILLPVGSNSVLRILREVLLLLLLWVFAAVAGFTPSVVRAAILFTLMSLTRCMQRDGSSVNSLAFAALIMLVLSPRWLFDISFQLSFAAVFSILLLTPVIDNLLGTYKRGTLYRYFAGIVSVSFAAQIGTLPFIWYYFGTFPLYFLATNFVVVPAAFLIMLLAVVMLLLFPLGWVRDFVALILDNLIFAVNYLLRLIEALPYSSLKLPDIAAWMAFVVAFVLVTGLYAVINRKWRVLIVSVIAALVIAGQLAYVSLGAVEPHILFFNSRNFSAVQLVESRQCSYLVSSYPQWEIDTRYVVEPYQRRECLSEPKLLPYCCYTDYNDEKVTISRGLLTFVGRRVKIVADEEWMCDTVIKPVDCLLLCRGFSGSIKELTLRYPANYVIMDATLYASSRKRIERECRGLGLRCVDLDKGARKMLVNKTGVRLVTAK